MSRLGGYILISLGLHAAVLGGLSVWGRGASNRSDAPGAAPQTVLLMRVGNPVPIAASAPSAPEAAPPRPELASRLRSSEIPVAPQAPPPPAEPRRGAKSGSPAAAAENLARGQSGVAQEEGGSAGTDAYLARLRRSIEEQKKYPLPSWRAGEQGQMIFRLRVDAQGRITSLDLIESHAGPRLVAAGEAAIRGAGPFGPPPAPWQGGLAVRVPIRFTLSRP